MTSIDLVKPLPFLNGDFYFLNKCVLTMISLRTCVNSIPVRSPG